MEGFLAFGGKAAVIGFLFISGFSIAASLRKQPQEFYARRLYRIYPLYFFAIFATAAIEYLTPNNVATPHHYFESLGLATTLGNLLFLQTIAVSAIAYNVAVWSLSIEFLYYIAAPFLTRSKWRIFFQVMAAISAISFISSTTNMYGPLWYIFTKLKLIKYFWCWYAGFFIYNNVTPKKIILFMALATTSTLLSEETPEKLAPLLIAIIFSAPLWIHRAIIKDTTQRAFNYLGDLSYSLYLLHLPSIIFAWHFFDIENIVLLSSISISTSMIAMHIIEFRLKPMFLKPIFFKTKVNSSLQ